MKVFEDQMRYLASGASESVESDVYWTLRDRIPPEECSDEALRKELRVIWSLAERCRFRDPEQIARLAYLLFSLEAEQRSSERCRAVILDVLGAIGTSDKARVDFLERQVLRRHDWRPNVGEQTNDER